MNSVELVLVKPTLMVFGSRCSVASRRPMFPMLDMMPHSCWCQQNWHHCGAKLRWLP